MTREIIVDWDLPFTINCKFPESFDYLTSFIFAMPFLYIFLGLSIVVTYFCSFSMFNS